MFALVSSLTVQSCCSQDWAGCPAVWSPPGCSRDLQCRPFFPSLCRQRNTWSSRKLNPAQSYTSVSMDSISSQCSVFLDCLEGAIESAPLHCSAGRRQNSCVLWQGHLKGCDPRYGISNQNCCFIMELLFLSWTPWMRKRVSISPRGPRHPKQEVRDRLCVCVLHIRLQQGCCCLYLLGTEILGAAWTRGESGLGTVMVFRLQVVGELLSQESLRCCLRVREGWTGG